MLADKTSKMIVAAASVGLWTGTQAFAGDRDDPGTRHTARGAVWQTEGRGNGPVTHITHDSQTRVTRRVHTRVASPQVYYRANNPQRDFYYSATEHYPVQSTQFYSTHNPRHGHPHGWGRPHHPHHRGHRGHFRSGWGHHRQHRHHGTHWGYHYRHHSSRCGSGSGVTIHVEF